MLSKKTQQPFNFLWGLKMMSVPSSILSTFYRGTSESIVTNRTTVWCVGLWMQALTPRNWFSTKFKDCFARIPPKVCLKTEKYTGPCLHHVATFRSVRCMYLLSFRFALSCVALWSIRNSIYLYVQYDIHMYGSDNKPEPTVCQAFPNTTYRCILILWSYSQHHQYCLSLRLYNNT